MKRYETPNAFKKALEHRLKTTSSSGTEMNRQRQMLIFDRFLARLVKTLGTSFVLKGGLVVELRLHRARTTKDVDLHVMGDQSDILSRLQDASRLDLDDFMRFEVIADKHHPEIQSEGMKYEGFRFKATCNIAGKIYGACFGVDVAFGDPMISTPDIIVAKDILDFAGISPPLLRVYPICTHIAEKLHAFTMPRTRPNSRVKDLPDIALLAQVGPLEAKTLRAALNQTFEYRKTHELPEALPKAAAAWENAYLKMAIRENLTWKNIDELSIAVSRFIDPILGKQTFDKWNPKQWSWI